MHAAAGRTRDAREVGWHTSSKQMKTIGNRIAVRLRSQISFEALHCSDVLRIPKMEKSLWPISIVSRTKSIYFVHCHFSSFFLLSESDVNVCGRRRRCAIFVIQFSELVQQQRAQHQSQSARKEICSRRIKCRQCAIAIRCNFMICPQPIRTAFCVCVRFISFFFVIFFSSFFHLSFAKYTGGMEALNNLGTSNMVVAARFTRQMHAPKTNGK